MKIIKYDYCKKVDIGTEDAPVFIERTSAVQLPYSDANIALAKKEAKNGEYTIEEVSDVETEPTAAEDTAAMLVDHEYRLTMLELGLTE